MTSIRRLCAAFGTVLALTLLAVVPTTASPSGAAAATTYPVPYGYAGFLAAGAAFLTGPGHAPPGANDWDCQPSAAIPTPSSWSTGPAPT